MSPFVVGNVILPICGIRPWIMLNHVSMYMTMQRMTLLKLVILTKTLGTNVGPICSQLVLATLIGPRSMVPSTPTC